MRVLQGTGRRFALLMVVLVLVGALGTAEKASADGAFVYQQRVSGTADFTSEVNPCTGEPFTATAEFVFVTNFANTPSGNSVGVDLGVFHGSGVGASGATYLFQTVGVESGGVFYAGPDRQVIIGLNPTFHFIRLSADGTQQDDWFWHAQFIVHIDLDTLTVTHEVGHFSSDCR
jgi:hypothetical protein